MTSKALGWHDDDIEAVRLDISNENVLTITLTKINKKEIKYSITLPTTGGGMTVVPVTNAIY